MSLSRHLFMSRGAPPPLADALPATLGTALRVGMAAGAVAVTLCGQQTTPRFDLLVINARIVDGTGGPSIPGSRPGRGGSIAGVGAVAGAAARTIDAGGHVVAPGFIDAHSHSDYSLLVDGNAESKVRQGVTTEVIGESESAAPIVPGASAGTRGTGLQPTWTDFTGYFAAIE